MRKYSVYTTDQFTHITMTNINNKGLTVSSALVNKFIGRKQSS